MDTAILVNMVTEAVDSMTWSTARCVKAMAHAQILVICTGASWIWRVAIVHTQNNSGTVN